jgi:hypothetical protein
MLGEGNGGGLRCVWGIQLPHGAWFRCADTGYGPSGRAGSSLVMMGQTAVIYGGDTGWTMSREAFALRPGGGSADADGSAGAGAGARRHRARSGTPHVIADGPLPASILLEAGPCCVCLSRRVQAVLVPCAHAALCAKCAVKMDGCPLCRSVIEGLVRLPRHHHKSAGKAGKASKAESKKK